MRNLVTFLLILIFTACTESTPKPRGRFRIEPPVAYYTNFTTEELPYTFHISQMVSIELPPVNQPQNWINIDYSSLNAKIYCSYQTITPATLKIAEDECRELVNRSVKHAKAIKEQTYEDPELNVYGRLFLIDGDTPSPIQFMLTDSSSKFFRGALYYQTKVETDSIAPITSYLEEDIVELIQSFHWK